MADFVSVQSGNWNDGATWGTTSPGVKGTDWPGLAGDTFTVSAGHTVSYNVSEAAELSASQVYGILAFITNASTKLAFGNASLTVRSTGKLQIGTELNKLLLPYTAEISFNPTSDNAQGIVVEAGGQVEMYGDPALEQSTTLADDAENTDGDNVIITNDDMSSLLHVGDEITIMIERKGDSSSYTDAIISRTIQNISGTSITLDAAITCQAEVGDTWVSYVRCITRNIIISKSGAITDIASSSRYNTNRPIFTDANTSGNCICNYVSFVGFYSNNSCGSFLGSIFRNGNAGLVGTTGATLEDCIFYCNATGIDSTSIRAVLNSCVFHAVQSALAGNQHSGSGNLFYGCNSVNLGLNYELSGKIFCCYTPFSSTSKNVIFEGDIYDCNYACFSACCVTLKNGVVCNCTSAFTYGLGLQLINMKIGWTSGGVSSPNITDFRDVIAKLINCKLPQSGSFTIYQRNATSGYLHLQSIHHDQVLDAHKTISNFYELTKVLCDGIGTNPSQDPDGGAEPCIEVETLSNVNKVSHACVFGDFYDSYYVVNAPASVQKTYTFKVQSTFTNTLTADELYLEAMYLSSATDGTQTVIKSTQTIAPRSRATDWSQVLSVTITPAQTGVIFFQIKLSKYESGKLLYVWPEAGIA